MPKEGLEPSRYCYRWILNPVRLPIPPLRQNQDNIAILTYRKKTVNTLFQPEASSMYRRRSIFGNSGHVLFGAITFVYGKTIFRVFCIHL